MGAKSDFPSIQVMPPSREFQAKNLGLTFFVVIRAAATSTDLQPAKIPI
jgi:hypothetical protein